jgi:hypothetical protein
MEDKLAIRRIIGLLANEDRFRIIAAVSLGANTVDTIAAMTGLDNAAIMKAIVKLEAAAIIQKKESAGYYFEIETLRALNREISKNAPKKAAQTILERFYKEGKLIAYPKVQKDREPVLGHIADLFEYEHQYSEKEINEKLKTVNPDFASLRRHLIDNEFFAREHTTDKEGCTVTFYWRVKHL